MAFPKPEAHAHVKARRKRQQQDARLACLIAVWERAQARCEHCGARVYTCQQAVVEATGAPVSDFFRVLGHVDEVVPRSRGGDPTDPANCQLLCFACHFSGPSGAHRVSTE